MPKTKKKEKNPLVSVIMNCHNGETYLKKSVDSIIQQTYKNWELVFFDNCSSDKSKKIIKNYNDKRIKYFSSKKYLKLYDARNIAIKKSKGKYISFLDTDDLWIRNKIKKQISFLKKNREFKIVFSNYYILNENKNKKFIKHKTSLPSGKITQKLLDRYTLGILTVFLEKSIFKKFKFKRIYNIIGDFDFFINLSKKFKISSIQKPLAFYRVHDFNLSSTNMKINIKELDQWIKVNEKALSNLGYSLKKLKFFLKKLKLKFFIKKSLGV